MALPSAATRASAAARRLCCLCCLGCRGVSVRLSVCAGGRVGTGVVWCALGHGDAAPMCVRVVVTTDVFVRVWA